MAYPEPTNQSRRGQQSGPAKQFAFHLLFKSGRGVSGESKFHCQFPGSFCFPESAVVIERTEAAAPHAVDVERAMQVIDFVLQDAGVPSIRLNAHRVALFVQAFDCDAAGTRHHGSEAWQAETAFKERGLRRLQKVKRWVDHNMKRDRAASTLGKLGFRQRAMILGLVFDHGELKRETHLRRSKADAGSILQGFAHVLDQFTNRCTANLLYGKRASLSPQDCFANGRDLYPHPAPDAIVPDSLLRRRCESALIGAVVSRAAVAGRAAVDTAAVKRNQSGCALLIFCR